MKKTLLTLLAVIALGSLTFAQINLTPKKIAEANTPSFTNKNIRSAWVGGGFTYFHTANAGDEFYIVGSEFDELPVGSNITKVKFYHRLGETQIGEETVTFTNTSYTIKIYENPTLTPIFPGYNYYETNIGTPIYTQTVALDESASDTFHELELTTPYIVNENDFWVALVFDNGVGAMRLGDANPANEGKYYMYYDGSMIVPVESQSGKHSLGISLYLDDGGAYEESSDLQAFFLTYREDPFMPLVTSANLAAGQNLVLNPAVQNNGPDATSNSVTISFSIDGTELNSQTIDPFNLANGYFTFIGEESLTLTPEDMNTLGLGASFEICMTATYSGTDPNVNNNTACVAVTRVTDVNDNIVKAVSVYPNPANDFVTVANAENANIVIVNMIGEVVANVNNASANQNIDISKLANGTYFVKVDGEVFKINVVK